MDYRVKYNQTAT